MALGALLKQARLEAGLSQRQLCGEEITRNMLSQIENGAARPSMDTLRYLAGRLGKPISYFLEEETVSSNQSLVQQAKATFAQGQWEQVQELYKQYQSPDPVFDDEMALLRALATMELAEQAIGQGKLPYAAALLRDMETDFLYFNPQLQRKRVLLLAKTQPKDCAVLSQQLPGMDDELLLRAQAAQQNMDWEKSGKILDAAEEKNESWHLLRGEAYYGLGQFKEAAEHFGKAEDKALARLESCYEQLGDYKMAYYYAKKQR